MSHALSAAAAGSGAISGSAWAKFKATQVLGESAAGIFSAAPLEYVHRENLEQELEAAEVEEQARRFGDLVWKREGVPPPDFRVVAEAEEEFGQRHRAVLSVFVLKPQQRLCEVRLLGPRRRTVEEARKDGSELRREAFRTAQEDEGALVPLRTRLRRLACTEWKQEELVGEDVLEAAECRLPEFTTATPAEKFKEQQASIASLRQWIYAKTEEQFELFAPVGPSWSMAGPAMSVPRLSGVWYVHERQREGGRPAPWLFFNASTGKYYHSQTGDLNKWTQTGTPHRPETKPLAVSHGAVCLPAAGGRKDDLAVALAELAKTGAALKFPLPFLDKPAALFLLADGLRGSSAAAEFCAKRFHTRLLPRLSARATCFEDHELLAIIEESVESLDIALLESSARYSGCGLAVALILGTRLVAATLGNCRVMLCTPRAGALRGGRDAEQWEARELAAVGGTDCPSELAEAERRRLRAASAPLDFAGAGRLCAASAAEGELAAAGDDGARAMLRVARASQPFAALDLRPADVHGGAAAVRAALQRVEGLLKERGESAAAVARVREAAADVEAMVRMDAYSTQVLAELYYFMDEAAGIPAPKSAAALLGVEPGCGETVAQAAVDRRYRALLAAIATVCPEHASRGFRILAEVAEAAGRPPAPAVWAPPVAERAAGFTRAMGFRDLKRPRRLVGTELAAEALSFGVGPASLMLLADGARALPAGRLAELAQLHQRRPRALCLRAALEASAALPGEAVSVVSVCVAPDAAGAGEPSGGAAAASSADPGAPEAKRRKGAEAGKPTPSGRPTKVRVAQLLLKFAGVGEADAQARRPAPPGRTQADAERELLEVIEGLLQLPAPERAARFAALCRERSDCRSALTVPHADLGWVAPGQMGKEFDAAAFELQPGDLSDILVSPRGAHLLYRLA